MLHLLQAITRKKRPTKVLEAVVDYGTPGSLDDLNILDQSNLFHDFLHGKTRQVESSHDNGLVV